MAAIAVAHVQPAQVAGPAQVPQLLLGGQPAGVISSASGMERGEVFYGPTDWLGSRDPMTHTRYTRGSSTELAD
jgi:hypothetical protein